MYDGGDSAMTPFLIAASPNYSVCWWLVELLATTQVLLMLPKLKVTLKTISHFNQYKTREIYCSQNLAEQFLFQIDKPP